MADHKVFSTEFKTFKNAALSSESKALEALKDMKLWVNGAGDLLNKGDKYQFEKSKDQQTALEYLKANAPDFLDHYRNPVKVDDDVRLAEDVANTEFKKGMNAKLTGYANIQDIYEVELVNEKAQPSNVKQLDAVQNLTQKIIKAVSL
jgi:hypothetical protein